MSNKPTLTATIAEFAKGLEKARAKLPAVEAAATKTESTGPKFNKMVMATIFLEAGVHEKRDGTSIDVILVKIRQPGGSENDTSSKAPYSHTFKGFTYHNVKAAGKSWVWDPRMLCYKVPVEDTELLFRGLGENFGGSEIILNGKKQRLPELPRADLLQQQS